MNKERKPPPYSGGKGFIGIILIIAGAILTAVEEMHGLMPEIIFFIIGGAFLFAYFYHKVYGFLIPACILLGLGMGFFMGGRFEAYGLIGLGGGFIAIYFIALAYEGNAHWWPFIPGSILIANGLTFLSARFLHMIFKSWPLIFVVAGAFLIADSFGWTGRKHKPRTRTHHQAAE